VLSAAALDLCAVEDSDAGGGILQLGLPESAGDDSGRKLCGFWRDAHWSVGSGLRMQAGREGGECECYWYVFHLDLNLVV
jgi:hypothetical protein